MKKRAFVNMASTKKHRQEWLEENMNMAIQHIQEKKMGWLLASKTFNVPATTLRRRFANNFSGRKGDLGGRRITLPPHLEQELATYVINMETRFFGLTTLNLRRLVFELAERNNIKHKFNKTSRLAGWKWVRVFLKRSSTISLRTPENTSLVDESGLSTVQTRPQKVFAIKGRKQVGTLSTAERGQHLTVVCSMNAIGTFVPPAFIFPRKRFKHE
ncbi:uncharacterized protein [Diabrotica undecimpunctata]|uniref:uncharacterized protein n=1 Tax=Diabrotica undecimpunctata TaxID=50387 RepID=UPI003B63B685